MKEKKKSLARKQAGITKKSPVKRAVKQKKSVAKKITKDMTIADVIKKYPQTIEVFFNYDLHCVGCFAAEFDTVESGAKVHSVNIEHLLVDLNKKIK